MNSIGAMSSPVKQALPPVLAPPTIISNSSPSKSQQPPNLTPLNLNTSQPLSLVNEHKNVPIVIPSSVIPPPENIVPKSTACNGIPDAKPAGQKIEEVLSKIEAQAAPRSQVNNSSKSSAELSLSEVKPQASGIENLSQKKEEKNNLPVNESSIKPDDSTKSENLKENDTKVNKEVTDSPAVQGQTASPEKNEQPQPNTSKGAVRRKREHKVGLILQSVLIKNILN